MIGIVAALLVGLLLAPGAANAAFVVPPAPTPPGPTPTPTAPGTPGAPGTPAPPSGQAPNDTVPAPSSPEAPASGPAAAPRTPADALRALPFSTLPAVANGVTCYIVVDKVTPTKPVSNVVGQGCHNGPRIPPLLNGLLPGGPGNTSPPAPGATPEPTPGSTPAPAPVPRLRSDGPNGASAGAPEETTAAAPQAAQAASVPIAEFYAGANYSGASFIIYGSGGGCDSLGYRLSDLAARNSSIGGASSYRTYNNCSNQAIHNQVDFGGTANFFTGYNRASLPSGYDNAVRSARLASVPCTYYNETNASVCGVIRDKYNALGGPDGPLGFPTSNELTNPDGVGKRSTFQGAASIYWTPATGAHDVRGPLRDAWARNGWETGPLGYPLSDQIAIATGDGRTNRFFKNNTYAAGTPTRNTGAIYWSPATNARALTGAIWDKYSTLGGATSILGYPTTDEVNTNKPGGRQNSFYQGASYAAGTTVRANGGIFWSASTGARELHAQVYDAYIRNGSAASCLGFPMSDATSMDGGLTAQFDGGLSRPAGAPSFVSWYRESDETVVSCDNDGSPDGVWASGYSSVPFTRQMQLVIDADPASRDAIVSTVERLAATAESGRDPQITGPEQSIQEDARELRAAASSLKTYGLPSSSTAPNRLRSGAEGLNIAASSAPQEAAAMAVPPEYELRGNPIANNKAWQVITFIDGKFCKQTCQLIDKITVRWTFNPGRDIDRYDFNALYSPSGGNFRDIYGSIQTFCTRAETPCGGYDAPQLPNPRNGTGSGQFAVGHQPLPGAFNTMTVALRALFIPRNIQYSDFVKSTGARCGTGDDLSCTFE